MRCPTTVVHRDVGSGLGTLAPLATRTPPSPRAPFLPAPSRAPPPPPAAPSSSHALLIPTRWAFWDGLRSYEAEFRPYLQGQIGNPDGDEKPNKKYYDPRMALRRGEEFMAKRLVSLTPRTRTPNPKPQS